MDFDQLATSVGKQFMTAWNAPIPFVAAVIALGFLIWKIAQREFANRLADSASKLDLAKDRVADYERKLEGASPDEAKARIEQLEARLDQIAPHIEALKPRTLTAEQRDIISRYAAPYNGGYLSIEAEGTCADAKQFAHAIALSFRTGGWDINISQVFGISELPKTGLAVMVRDPEDLLPGENVVTFAFEQAGLQFSIERGDRFDYPHRPTATATVRITERFVPTD